MVGGPPPPPPPLAPIGCQFGGWSRSFRYLHWAPVTYLSASIWRSHHLFGEAAAMVWHAAGPRALCFLRRKLIQFLLLDLAHSLFFTCTGPRGPSTITPTLCRKALAIGRIARVSLGLFIIWTLARGRPSSKTLIFQHRDTHSHYYRQIHILSSLFTLAAPLLSCPS